jgi:RHS repeat-associated protein
VVAGFGLLGRAGARRGGWLAVLLSVLVLVSGLPAAPSAVAAVVQVESLSLSGPGEVVLGASRGFTGVLTASSLGVPATEVQVRLDGRVVAKPVTAVDGSFAALVTFDLHGTHEVQAVARAGTALETRSEVVRVEVVPGLDETEPTDVHDSTTFIYTGPSAPQTGVEPGTIEPERAAVLRGAVRDRAGVALDGVTVSVPGHPEFGSTSSSKGAVDMVVNGGKPLTLRYSKPGFLPVERQVDVDWREREVLPEVVLTPLDAAVTTVVAGAATTTVARANPVSDADGGRRATLLFPAGTQAVMHLPDGSTEQLDTLAVRATEYTVGEAGPAAMPGALPPVSGYTYAVEYSVDEAITAGATEVMFDRPVATYTENFLGFPVGMAVPAGYYDSGRHAWLAAPNGRVVQVVAVMNGMAELDVSGDGQAETAAELAKLGVDDAERTKLAELYVAGQSLWRVPVTHFTPWDYNWPYGPPPGAVGPDGKPIQPQPGQCDRSGSVIGCENQTLGEAVPVTGTGLALHYDTERTAGYQAAHSINVPLTGAALPDGLRQVTLDITVAGRRFTSQFPATPQLSHTFVWDGLDAYGRPIHGVQDATVRVGYVYGAVYYAPGEFSSSFGQPGTGVIEGSRARQEITLSQQWTTKVGRLGGTGRQALAGWTLSAHHAYDVDARVLHLGDATTRLAESTYSALARFAGTGAAGPAGDGTFSGDGGAATSAGLSDVKGLATAADGSVLVADAGNARIRRVAPDGTISTFAGGGTPTTGNGDGGPATGALLTTPADVALGADGSIYILDTGDASVRKVAPDGTISTVVGGGLPADGLGDNGPATQAALSSPRGLAVTDAGDLYIADTGNNRLRHVSPDGRISTFAGGGAPADGLGDGLSATRAALAFPLGVAVGLGGEIYVADADHDRVRRIGVDGLISTVAGSGGTGGDGGPARAAAVEFPTALAVDRRDGTLYITQRLHHRIRAVDVAGIINTIAGTGAGGTSPDTTVPARGQLRDPQGVHVGRDGAIYLADTGNFTVRRIITPLPGFGAADLLIPSADGNELYHFNPGGRHLRTLDAATKLLNVSFDYDDQGRLAALTDRFANRTSIEWSSTGTPSAIVSPFGHRTTLAVDAAGNLAGITNPAGEAVTMTYGDGGLLTGFTNPRGHSSAFSYDQLGRLTRDLGPDGHATTLARTDTPTGQRVTATSAEGRVTTYDTARLDTGELQRTVTEPSGARARSTRRTDGTVVGTAADGTTTTLTYSPDPRWGMQTPYASQVVTRTPAGKSLTSTTARTVTLAQTGDPLSMTSRRDTITANGKTTTRVWDATAGTLTTTSAGSRSSTTTLNEQGQVARVEEAGRPVATFTYDSRGRRTATTIAADGQSRTASFAYGSDGMLSSTTDAHGDTTGYTRDAVGRVLTSTLPDGSTPHFGYDSAGNLTSLSPPERTAHTFSHTAGNLTKQYSPPQPDPNTPAATEFTYNNDRQPLSIAHPDGRSSAFNYDSAGRIASSTISRGTTSFSYQPDSSRLSRIDAPEGQYQSYSYDGPLLTALNSPTGQVSYSYDNDWRVSSFSLNGTSTTLTYNTDGLLTGAGPLSLTRDSSGQATSTSLGAVTTSHSFNGFTELSRYSASATTTSGTTTTTTGLYDSSLTRDNLGRVTSKTETVAGTATTYGYSYDNRGRLSAVSTDGTLTASYSYDRNGNRTSSTTPAGTTNATFDSQDRILTSGDTTFTHTPDGQLDTATGPAGTTGYRYDERGALTAVTLPDGTAISYSHDAAGRRAATHVNGTTTQRLAYGTGLQPLAELDAAGNITARYIYAGHSHVPDYLVKNGTTYRIIHDQLGSPRLVVDTTTGAITQQLDYDAWGNTTTDTNPGFQPFGYAGGLHDPHTKLLRYGARDYNPATGRWTTRDPIGFAGGDTNLYAYVNNNPANYTDPTGEILFLPALAAAWAVTEIALAVADAISTASVILDQCASGLDKALAGGLFALGALAPGGGYSTAGKAAEAAEDASGIVYRRTDLAGSKPYVGQSKSEGRYFKRQGEHGRANPDADFEFEIIGRARPGSELDRLEEYYIRQGGGPTNLSNPNGGLANWRHQMSDERYRSAGGDPRW